MKLFTKPIMDQYLRRYIIVTFIVVNVVHIVTYQEHLFGNSIIGSFYFVLLFFYLWTIPRVNGRAVLLILYILTSILYVLGLGLTLFSLVLLAVLCFYCFISDSFNYKHYYLDLGALFFLLISETLHTPVLFYLHLILYIISSVFRLLTKQVAEVTNKIESSGLDLWI